jgi:predicted TIM-barrel fold metal-dependent hydrolase
MAALGLGAASTGVGRLSSAFAQEAAIVKPGMIDVHHHHIPPFYLAENRERIAGSRGGQISPAWLNWTPEHAIEAMDKTGVSSAVLSLSTPGVWFGDAREACQTARRVNEYAADLARSHPGRFGLFAAIPLPDTEGSLREIEYAFDVLKADGIGVLSSYGDKWLGDSAYLPVFEELNRRKAVVFEHPTTPLCCRTLLPDVAPLVAEMTHDTTRAITNLLFTGTFSRFKDIKFIFSHAGGNVAMAYGRMLQYGPKDIAEKAPNGIEYEFRRLYYDIAGTAFKPAIAALTSLVPMTQLLLGSDNPYVPLGDTTQGITRLGLSAADLHAIGRDNVLAILPGLKKTPK